MPDHSELEIPLWIELAIDLDPVAAAMVIASFVRDKMEDFHGEHLTDEQMAELNPLLRQGICDALTFLQVAADEFDPRFHAALLGIAMKEPPPYWEHPDPQRSFGDLEAAQAYLRRSAARDRRPDDPAPGLAGPVLSDGSRP